MLLNYLPPSIASIVQSYTDIEDFPLEYIHTYDKIPTKNCPYLRTLKIPYHQGSLEFLKNLNLERLDLHMYLNGDMSPIQTQKNLKYLDMSCYVGKFYLEDSKIEELHINYFSGTDLSVLRDIPLKILSLENYNGFLDGIENITSLKEVRLNHLDDFSLAPLREL